MIGTKFLCAPSLLRQAGFLRLALGIFVFNAGYSVYLFLFNFFLAAQGQNEARMGSLTGAMVLGGVLGALPAPRAANRFGSVRTLAISLLFSGVFLALRLCPVPFLVQWIFAAASGFFLIGWTVLIFPLIAATVPQERRASAFQLLYGLATGAGCIGAIIGGNLPGLCARFLPLLSQPGRERLVLLAAAALVCLSALSLPHAQSAEPVTILTRLRPTRRLAGLLAISAFWAFLLGAMNPFSGIYFLAQFRMGISAIGGFFFLVQAVAALGLFLLGASRLSSLPARKLFLGSQLLVALSFLGLSAHLLWLAEAAYLLFMLAQQCSQPALQSLLLHSASASERNSIAGWNTLFTAIFQSIAAQAFGIIWGHWGYAAILPLLALATLLATAIAAFCQNDPAPESLDRATS
jgi:predicted MFS family arabinose efflux permease